MRNHRLGVVNPGTVLTAGKTIWDTVKNVFSSLGIGDSSPNYPIKSKNTEAALKREVAALIPPPTSVEHAKQLIQVALAQKEKELKRDNSKRVIDSIRMMYDEAIQALNAYIQQNTGRPYNPEPYVPGPNDNSGTGTGQRSFLEKNWPLLAGGALAVYLLTRKGNRRR